MVLLYMLPLLGAIPLTMILVKMRNAKKITDHGVKTDAVVVKINSWSTGPHNRIDTLTLQYNVGGEKGNL